MQNKKIIILGGTGFIGRNLSEKLSAEGWSVVIFTRKQPTNHFLSKPNVQYVQWNVDNKDEWLHHLEGAYAIINLAGENISALRWTKKKKQKIRDSRLNTIQLLIQSIKQLQIKPKVLIQAVGIGIYGDRGDEKLDDFSEASTGGFLTRIAIKQENYAKEAEQFGVRVINVRTAIVLGKGGGFLKLVKIPFLLFFGGHLGTGLQWVSWIHMNDYVNALIFLLKEKNIKGGINLTAPHPVQAKVFYRSLGKALNRPSWFHVPKILLNLFMGDVAKELILSGQRATPQKMLDAGFNYLYPDVDSAFDELIK